MLVYILPPTQSFISHQFLSIQSVMKVQTGAVYLIITFGFFIRPLNRISKKKFQLHQLKIRKITYKATKQREFLLPHVFLQSNKKFSNLTMAIKNSSQVAESVLSVYQQNCYELQGHGYKIIDTIILFLPAPNRIIILQRHSLETVTSLQPLKKEVY